MQRERVYRDLRALVCDSLSFRDRSAVQGRSGRTSIGTRAVNFEQRVLSRAVAPKTTGEITSTRRRPAIHTSTMESVARSRDQAPPRRDPPPGESQPPAVSFRAECSGGRNLSRASEWRSTEISHFVRDDRRDAHEFHREGEDQPSVDKANHRLTRSLHPSRSTSRPPWSVGTLAASQCRRLRSCSPISPMPATRRVASLIIRVR